MVTSSESQKLVRFEGTLKTVTKDGKGGIIKFDALTKNFLRAVIDADTQGLDELPQKEGRLVVGSRVRGVGLPGKMSLTAVEVQNVGPIPETP